MPPPVKPFDSYKWRWLSFQPTEGLLQASVFLGVLRALQDHEGQRFSSPGLRVALQRVQNDTQSTVRLARYPTRNLFRNSGQYWRGTGLLARTPGRIQLTPLGRDMAQGAISRDDFVALMVRNTVLPNPLTYSNTELGRWRAAGLRVKPFEVMLAVMNRLGTDWGLSQACLTPNELIRVIVPLAGERTSIADMARFVHEHRLGDLDVSTWPDCAPDANDKRLAREFLLFLENFGVCRTDPTTDGYGQRFILDQVLDDDLLPNEQHSFLENEGPTDEEVAAASASEILEIVERRRILTHSIDRTGQRRFRQEVLQAAQGRCLITNEGMSDVLEAAHIIPVEHGGDDLVGNGLCLRADVHRLFDKGRIRIRPDGTIIAHNVLAETASYARLPDQVAFPGPVNIRNVDYRERYL